MTTKYDLTNIKCSNITCNLPAVKVKHGTDTPYCTNHFWDSYKQEKNKTNEFVNKLYTNGYAITHTPGTTYVIQLPNMNYKIGTTTQDVMTYLRNGIRKQWNEHYGYTPGFVTVLSTIDGGESLERQLHYKFQGYRLTGPLEQFQPVPDIRDFALSSGFMDLSHNTSYRLFG